MGCGSGRTEPVAGQARVELGNHRPDACYALSGAPGLAGAGLPWPGPPRRARRSPCRSWPAAGPFNTWPDPRAAVALTAVVSRTGRALPIRSRAPPRGGTGARDPSTGSHVDVTLRMWIMVSHVGVKMASVVFSAHIRWIHPRQNRLRGPGGHPQRRRPQAAHSAGGAYRLSRAPVHSTIGRTAGPPPNCQTRGLQHRVRPTQRRRSGVLWLTGRRQRGRNRSPGEVDRTPPHDVAAEQCVLGAGCCCPRTRSSRCDGDDGETIITGGAPDHPLKPSSNNCTAGAERWTRSPSLTCEQAGAGPCGRSQLSAHAHRVRAHRGQRRLLRPDRGAAILRRLVEVGTRIVQLGYSGDGEADELVDRAQAEVYGSPAARGQRGLPAHIMPGALDEIEAIGSHGGKMLGRPPGLPTSTRSPTACMPARWLIAIGKALALDTASRHARRPGRRWVRSGSATA